MRLDAYAELRSSSADVQGYRYDANGNMIARLEAGVLYAQSWDTENRLVGVTYGPFTSQTNSSYSFGYDPDGGRMLQVAPDGARSAYVGAGLYEETVNATTVFADSFPTSAGNWAAQSGSWSWVSAGPGEGYYAQQSKLTGQSTSIRTPAVVWGDITATVRLQVGAQQNALVGVVLRRPAGGGASYFLGVRNSLSSYGCGIYEYDGAAWVLRAGGGTACKVAQSTWQTVGVRAINGRLDLLVGGKLVASWTDTSPQGANGFGLQTFDGEGSFDDVQVYGAGARSYYLFGGKRVAMAQSSLALTGSAGEEYYLLSDHLGSTSLALYPNAGEVAGSRGWYYPFGDVRGTAPSGLPTDFQYAGQRLVGIGLYSMGARWYNPRSGRWSSPDSIVPDPSNPQGLNRYSYVRGNPVNYRDPNGHKECAESCPGDKPSPPVPLPWYAPAVFFAADAVGAMNRALAPLEADRLVKYQPIAFSLNGGVSGGRVVASSAYSDTVVDWSMGIRVTEGGRSLLRVDPTGLTGKYQGRESRLDTSLALSHMWKSPKITLASAGDAYASTNGRTAAGLQPVPPLNVAVRQTSGLQVNIGAGPIDAELSLDLRATTLLHGGPTGLAMAPVVVAGAAYTASALGAWAAGAIGGALSGLGAAAPSWIPSLGIP